MFKILFSLLLLTNLILPSQLRGETALDIYMNDFYNKSKEASLILKQIETSLKQGSRDNVCSRQREAARLGLLANQSLIKAFEVAGKTPPMKSIKESQLRWESMLNAC